jgi:hypothetical protein
MSVLFYETEDERVAFVGFDEALGEIVRRSAKAS